MFQRPGDQKKERQMILFFPQWQGAGRGHRLDAPARLLLKAVLDRAVAPSETPAHVCEVPLDPGESLGLERGIWGRSVLLQQLNAAHDLLAQHPPKPLFTLGGDCGIEIVPVGRLNAATPDFALIWIDAHADLNTPETSPSGTFHGMPLRVLCGEGDSDFVALVSAPLRPEQVVMVGVRDFDPGERAYADGHQLAHFAAGTPALAERLTEHLRRQAVRNLYLHIDLDSLDPQEFSAVDFPVAGGFGVEALAGLVQSLSDAFSIVGMSLTEYSSASGAGLDTLAPLLDAFARLYRKSVV